jgi:hypothetical protein
VREGISIDPLACAYSCIVACATTPSHDAHAMRHGAGAVLHGCSQSTAVGEKPWWTTQTASPSKRGDDDSQDRVGPMRAELCGFTVDASAQWKVRTCGTCYLNY